MNGSGSAMLRVRSASRRYSPDKVCDVITISSPVRGLVKCGYLDNSPVASHGRYAPRGASSWYCSTVMHWVSARMDTFCSCTFSASVRMASVM